MEAEGKAQLFDLKTPMLRGGRSNTVLAQTDLMTVTIKYYNEGGENALHAHPAEDHAFVVLDGAARFYDKDNQATIVKKGQGILVPKKWYYRFENCGNGPLILLRFGAAREKAIRMSPEGKPLPGDSAENKHREGIPIEGRYWEMA